MNVRPNVRSWLRFALLSLIVAYPAILEAQHTMVPPPTAYALQGATLVQADGRRTEGVTLVIRGSFIETLSASAPIPADAQLLEGEDLVVYPGLIDAQGEVAYEFPALDIDRSQVRSWDPPRSAQGFMPHRRVVDFLEATGSDLGDQRKKGVVAAAVYPTTGLMPGRGTFLMMRKGADSPMQLVHTPDIGPVMTLRGGMGYPTTLFAVLSFYRQTFEDAARMKLISTEYARDSRGLTPPPYDPDFAVVQEAMSGGIRTFVVANSAEDIRRVLDLTDQYGISPIIVGGEEAWRVADQLKARNIPVLISLDFAKPQYWEPAKEVEGPLDPAEHREKVRLEEAYANAGKLAEAGVTFALTSGGGKADLLEGARKVIEYGLSEAAALRALTTTPAELFGVSQVVRIEEGRPATFIVSSGSLFEKDSRIAYTFVEGELEKGPEPRRSGNARQGGDTGGAASDLGGTWTASLDSEAGSTGGRMTLEQSGSTFTGSISGSEMGQLQIEKGTISGDEIEFVLIFQFGDERAELPFRGRVSGSSLNATGSSPFGQVTMSARRSGGSEVA